MTTPIVPTPDDIEVIQGATYKMRVTWNDDQATPQPISLTGWRAHMQIRAKRGGTGTLLANLSSDVVSDDGSLTLEPESLTGTIDVKVSALMTAKLKKSAFYDLFVIKTDDPTEAVRLVYGTVDISTSATVNT